MKCLLKAGFPEHATANTQDVAMENLQTVADLCKQGQLPDDATNVINLDNEHITTEDFKSAGDCCRKQRVRGRNKRRRR